jgi:hypothetical protein
VSEFAQKFDSEDSPKGTGEEFRIVPEAAADSELPEQEELVAPESARQRAEKKTEAIKEEIKEYLDGLDAEKLMKICELQVIEYFDRLSRMLSADEELRKQALTEIPAQSEIDALNAKEDLIKQEADESIKELESLPQRRMDLQFERDRWANYLDEADGIQNYITEHGSGLLMERVVSVLTQGGNIKKKIQLEIQRIDQQLAELDERESRLRAVERSRDNSRNIHSRVVNWADKEIVYITEDGHRLTKSMQDVGREQLPIIIEENRKIRDLVRDNSLWGHRQRTMFYIPSELPPMGLYVLLSQREVNRDTTMVGHGLTDAEAIGRLGIYDQTVELINAEIEQKTSEYPQYQSAFDELGKALKTGLESRRVRDEQMQEYFQHIWFVHGTRNILAILNSGELANYARHGVSTSYAGSVDGSGTATTGTEAPIYFQPVDTRINRSIKIHGFGLNPEEDAKNDRISDDVTIVVNPREIAGLSNGETTMKFFDILYPGTDGGEAAIYTDASRIRHGAGIFAMDGLDRIPGYLKMSPQATKGWYLLCRSFRAEHIAQLMLQDGFTEEQIKEKLIVGNNNAGWEVGTDAIRALERPMPNLRIREYGHDDNGDGFMPENGFYYYFDTNSGKPLV